MPRSRVNGLTEEQKNRVLRWDRTPPNLRKNTAYDVRRWHDEVLTDLQWLYSDQGQRGARSRFAFHPIDVIIPSDLKKTRETVAWIEDAISMLSMLRDLVAEEGLRSMRMGRY